MAEEEKKIAVALPFEWVAQKVLGPVFDEFGDDLKSLYKKGRDAVFLKASRKIANIDDGKRPNVRVARDVLWNGAITDDEVCAEYFGGVLASSRTEDGKDDDAIQFVDTIKSLSSRQLRLHYILYNSLNRLLFDEGSEVNVGNADELNQCNVWFYCIELRGDLGLKLDVDLMVLYKQGLISTGSIDDFQLQSGKFLPYAKIGPTAFGVLLYLHAHNLGEEWLQFPRKLFGDFENVKLPVYYARSIEALVEKIEEARKRDHSRLQDV